MPCLNSITDWEANIMCKAEGYMLGGSKISKNNKDPVPTLNKLSGFARMISCPRTNRIFGQKCMVSVLPPGKHCNENYDLIKCYGEQVTVTD